MDYGSFLNISLFLIFISDFFAMSLCFLFSHVLLCSLQYAVMLATRPILVFGIISQSFSTAYIYAIISWTYSLSALPLFLSIMFRALLSFEIMFVQISCSNSLFECFTLSYSLHFAYPFSYSTWDAVCLSVFVYWFDYISLNY